MPELDGIRGLAILLVLLWHFGTCQIGTGGSGFMGFAAQAGSLLWSGVNLFFVLSGFLIVGILLDNKGAPSLLRVFYTRRIFRIFPLYIAVCAAFACALYFSPPQMAWLLDNPLPLWSYLTFTQNFVMAAGDSFGAKAMAPTWSLAVEEQFYLLIPFMVRYMSRRTVLASFVALVLIAPLLRLLLDGIGGYVLFLARADSIMLGGLLAFVVRDARAMAFLRRQRRVFMGMVAVLATGAIALSFYHAVPPLTDPFVNFWLSFLYGGVVLMPFVCPRFWAVPLLRAGALRWLGTRSYGIYMLHMGVAGMLHGYLLGWEPALYSVESGLVTLLALGATFCLAEFSYRYVESPLTRLGQQASYGKHRAGHARRPDPAPGQACAQDLQAAVPDVGAGEHVKV